MMQITPRGGRVGRGRSRMNRAGGLTTSDDGEQLGRDYVVSYATSPYQNGTLVLRFVGEPDRKDLIDAVVGYGVVADQITEIDARPVPSLAERQALREKTPRRGSSGSPDAATWLPTTRRPRPASPPTGSTESARRRGGAGDHSTTTAGRSRSGCGLGSIIGAVAVGFVVLSILNVGAFSEGRSTGGYYPETGEDRIGYCAEMIGTLAPPDQGLLSQLFSDSPTTFAVTPPNTAYLAGCMIGD